MSTDRVWLITGSSSGFGRIMGELALKNGEKVVATLRKPAELDDLRKEYREDRLLVVPLDVTKPDDISNAFRAAKSAFGRVDIVFNNAGVVLVGEVEGTPDARARTTFEVNFWGAANVSREAVRFFREENAPGVGGWLLNVSSFLAIQPSPPLGYYSASKHALDGLTQILASELDPKWNIKVVLIEPGYFRTSIVAKGDVLPPPAAYTQVTSEIRKFATALFDPSRPIRIGDADKAVKQIHRLTKLTSPPPARLILGLAAQDEVKAKIASLTKDLEDYASWSEDLLED